MRTARRTVGNFLLIKDRVKYMKICVFGAASSAIDTDFKIKVEELGKEMVNADTLWCLAVAQTA